MKPAGALKLCPYVIAIFALSLQPPGMAAPTNSEKKPQAAIAASPYITPIKDKYGFPAVQIEYFFANKDSQAIKAILRKTPHHAGDEDRRLMLEAAMICLNNNFEGALPLFSKVKHPEEATNIELYMAAKTFALAQNFKRAVAIASIGVKRSNNQKCLEIRGVSYSNMNSFAEAIEDFETLARTQPSWASDYLSKEADLLMRLNKYPEALEVAKRAQKCDPGDAAPPCTKGMCLVKLGLQREAVQAFTQSMENARKDIHSKREAAFFLTTALRERAKCYLAMGKVKEAEADKAELATYSDKLMDELIGN